MSSESASCFVFVILFATAADNNDSSPLKAATIQAGINNVLHVSIDGQDNDATACDSVGNKGGTPQNEKHPARFILHPSNMVMPIHVLVY